MFFGKIIVFLLIIVSKEVFCLTKKETADLKDNTEKRLTVLKKHIKYWYKNIADVTEEMLLSSDCEIAIPADIKKTGLLAALYERFVAIELNVLCWRCAWFVTKACKSAQSQILCFLIDNRKKYAKKCAAVGEVLSWYNDQFSAKMFVEAHKKYLFNNLNYLEKNEFADYKSIKLDCEFPTKREEKESDEPTDNEDDSKRLNIEDLALKIDSVLEKLKEINKIFMEANLEYDNVVNTFTIGEEQQQGLSSENEEEIHGIINRALWSYLGTDYLDVFNYMMSFFQEPDQVEDFNLSSTSRRVIEKDYKIIRNAAEIKKRYCDVQKILSLEYEHLNVRIKAEKIKNLPTDFDRTAWTAKWKKSGFSDYEFMYGDDYEYFETSKHPIKRSRSITDSPDIFNPF